MGHYARLGAMGQSGGLSQQLIAGSPNFPVMSWTPLPGGGALSDALVATNYSGPQNPELLGFMSFHFLQILQIFVFFANFRNDAKILFSCFFLKAVSLARVISVSFYEPVYN